MGVAQFQRWRRALARLVWPQLAQLELMALRAVESERRLRNIADHVPVLIDHVDTALRFQFCNETFRAWAGLAPEHLTGRTLKDSDDQYHMQRLARLKPYLQRALAGEQVEVEIAPFPAGISAGCRPRSCRSATNQDG